mmetsp:Transcript_3284/g.11032  ORF Transcript_3284/g.11032 Transcript_3284/m.11032 type:complete len:261 (-) Transcript_3284:34-816(-)
MIHLDARRRELLRARRRLLHGDKFRHALITFAMRRLPTLLFRARRRRRRLLELNQPRRRRRFIRLGARLAPTFPLLLRNLLPRLKRSLRAHARRRGFQLTLHRQLTFYPPHRPPSRLVLVLHRVLVLVLIPRLVLIALDHSRHRRLASARTHIRKLHLHARQQPPHALGIASTHLLPRPTATLDARHHRATAPTRATTTEPSHGPRRRRRRRAHRHRTRTRQRRDVTRASPASSRRVPIDRSRLITYPHTSNLCITQTTT